MPLKPALAEKRFYFISAGIALFVFLLHFTHLIDFHELDAFDMRLKIRGKESAHPSIVILEIDDPSLAAVGQWPWPRAIHAALLDVLSRYNPKLVFFDILFTEAGPNSEHDQSLADMIKKSGNVIVPFYFYSENPFEAFFPIEKFRDAAVDTGFVNVVPDADGKIRKFRTFIRADDKIYYHPSVLSMFLQIKDGEKAKEWFKTLPADRKGRMWLNYPGGVREFKHISFWEVIEAVGSDRDKEMRELFSESIVLVGQTATGTTDLKATPFTPLEPGIAIQASAIHTLLTQKYYRATPVLADLLLLILFAVLTAWVTQIKPPKEALIISTALIAGYGAVNIGLFYFFRLIMPLFVPPVVIGASYFTMLFMKYVEVRFKAELNKRELETAARIQENFLPASMPEVAGLDIAFACKFIKEVGGDLYDWVDFGKTRVGVCVGDVSGKGVPAALYMAKAMSEFRRDYKNDAAPGKVSSSLNDHLARSGTPGMFLTFFYAVIDTEMKKISFSSAGHDPMVFYIAKENKAVMHEEAQGTPLGLFEGSDFESADVSYESGDMLVVVTDGIKELRNLKREEFGMDRLRELVENLAQKKMSSAETIQEVFQAMTDYQKGAAPHDDRTILCIRFL